MTILAACYTPEGALIGHDTGHTLNGVVLESRDKVVLSEDGKTLLAIAGESRWQQLIYQAGCLESEQRRGAWKVCLAIREALRADGAVGDTSSDAWLWRTGFFGILWHEGSIYVVDGAITPHWISEEVGFAAVGAGEDFARGAWSATSGLIGIRDRTERLRLAVAAAIEWSPYCHGDVVLHAVKSR